MPTSRRRLLLLVLLPVLLLLLLAGLSLRKLRRGLGVWQGQTDPTAAEQHDPTDAVLRGAEAADPAEAAAAGMGAGTGAGAEDDTIADCLVKGRVVDAETGEAISEAWFFLWPQRARQPENPFWDWVEAPEGEREACARVTYTVDPDGRFGLAHGLARASRGQMLELYVIADGYVPHWGPLEIPGTCIIALRRGATLGGRVVDEAGHAVADATVMARAGGTRGAGWAWGPVSAWDTTEADGTYELSGLPESQGSLVQAVAGLRRSTAVTAWPGQDPVLVVGAPVRVALDVSTADGEGMAWAYLRDEVGNWGELLWDSGWAEPPTERRISPLPLPPGTLPDELLLVVPGYATARVPLAAGVSEQRHAVALERRADVGRIRVRLTWPETGGENEIYLRVRDAGYSNLRGAAEGVCARRVIPPRTQGITLPPLWSSTYELDWVGTDIGYEVARLQVGPNDDQTLTVDLKRGGSLRVVLADAPAGGAQVTIRRAEGAQEGWMDFARPLQPASDFEGHRPLDECLPGALRWGEQAVAIPDGSGAAVADVFGLAPGRYRVQVYPAAIEARDSVDVEVVAGQTTRVVVPRRGQRSGSEAQR